MAYANDKSPHHVINMDGTQIMVVEKGSGQYMAHYCDENSDGERDVAKTMQPGETAIFVKIMAMNNSAGVSAPNFAGIAVPELAEDQFLIIKIQSLGITSCMDDFGYIVFSKKRTGNSQIWKHYLNENVKEFLKNIQNKLQLKNIDGTPMGFFFYLDGEAQILCECYDPEVEQIFEDLKVNAAKGVESGTGEHQGNDRATTFKNVKQGAKEVASKAIDVSNQLIRSEMKNAFKMLSNRYQITVTAKFIEKVTYALEVCIYCWNTYSSPTKIRKGYHVRTLKLSLLS
jgi:hypothetical protein